jgi:hypothetical protein
MGLLVFFIDHAKLYVRFFSVATYSMKGGVMAFVVDFETGKETDLVLQRMERWQKLRQKPPKIIEKKIILKILNAVWKAYNRAQENATVWIVAETESSEGQLSDRMLLADRTCGKALQLLKALGCEADSMRNYTGYKFYKSKVTPQGELVAQLCVVIGGINKAEVGATKSKMFSEFALLPQTERGTPHKKKKRKRKKKRS